MKILSITLIAFIFLLNLSKTYAAEDIYPVSNLPADNLIQNPWFADKNINCVNPKLEPWISMPELVTHAWTASNKPSNPNPLAGCYTAARISTGRIGGGETVLPDQDIKLYQVVKADPSQTKAIFDMYWVTHTVNKGIVKVYGSSSSDPNSNWTELWTPFSYSKASQLFPPKGEDQAWLWRCYSEHYAECSDAPKLPATTTFSKGYPYYKIEFTFNLPSGAGGFKHTGVYFTVNNSNATPTEETVPTKLPSIEIPNEATIQIPKEIAPSFAQKVLIFLKTLFAPILQLFK